jgi:hypothetical protein
MHCSEISSPYRRNPVFHMQYFVYFDIKLFLPSLCFLSPEAFIFLEILLRFIFPVFQFILFFFCLHALFNSFVQ